MTKVSKPYRGGNCVFLSILIFMDFEFGILIQTMTCAMLLIIHPYIIAFNVRPHFQRPNSLINGDQKHHAFSKQ